MAAILRFSNDIPGLSDLIPAPLIGALGSYSGSFLRHALSPEDIEDAFPPVNIERCDASRYRILDWLLAVRSLEAVQLNVRLPRPGKIGGLVPPREFIMHSLEGSQGLVVASAGLAVHSLAWLSPARRGFTLLREFETPQVPVELAAAHASSQRERLYRTLDSTHDELHAEGLVPDEPVKAESLPSGWVLMMPPPGMHPWHVESARLAGRLTVLAQARLDELADSGIDPHPRSIQLMNRLLDESMDVIAGALSYVEGADI